MLAVRSLFTGVFSKSFGLFSYIPSTMPTEVKHGESRWVSLPILICLVSRQRFLLHIQLPSYLFTLSVIFFHQVFIHRPSIILSNQVSYRGGRGWGLEYTFLNLLPPLEFFIFLLYPLKFQTKQSSTPGNSTLFFPCSPTNSIHFVFY